VYWRITITNPTAFRLAGLSRDSREPSCTADNVTIEPAGSVVVICASHNVTTTTINTVNVTVPPPPGAPPGAPPYFAPPASAEAEVFGVDVVKEVCEQKIAADCGPDGAGPWGPVASVPIGATAYWRITVTNNSTVDADGVTLSDGVAPGCATAAGTFNVPAGASTRFFCSTPNIQNNTVNSVTASVPPPPDAPPGTPPAVSSPGTAEAAVFSVTVVKEICTSRTATECAAGGPGPWAANAPVPPGGTAFWRITVHNPSAFALPGITLHDTDEPTCAAAAGTFALAPDEQVRFFCSTAGITTDTANTVTATVPPPAGSPPGTPPFLSPESTATAQVFSLTVRKEVCRSLVATECEAGGAGPWAAATALPIGSTAYWRITITNPSVTTFTNITLTDPQERSCLVALGEGGIALGGGTSATFFCNTPDLTTDVANTATVSAPPPSTAPPGTPTIVSEPSTATASVYHVALAKQVCASSTPADCGPGDNGPWTDSTTVPTGGRAFWRISVTNPSTVDLTGLTLADAEVPACASAAGSFDLAAGATTRFFCSSIVDTTVTNVATAIVPPPPTAPPGTPPLVSPGGSATANTEEVGLSVLKQICGSTQAADCTPDGPGPWSSHATVPLGGTAHWRIVVTNAGRFDLTAITLDDPIEPSCATAAGTFDLAAGATVRFGCQTIDIRSGVTNTAAAVFTPPGSEFPVRTAGSSATATPTGGPTPTTPPTTPPTVAPSPPPLAITGSGLTPLIWVGGVLLVLGSWLAALAYRRRFANRRNS
jgi:uncharacterized repeat protein (TIGR01451 family)